MLVKEQDIAEIKDYLQSERWNNGYEYVAYPDDGFPVDKYQLMCFGTDKEAQEYCHEAFSVMEKFNFIGIRTAYRTMLEGLQGLVPLIQRNGAIDVAAMVLERHQNLQNEQLIYSKHKKGEVMNVQEKNENTVNEENFSLIGQRIKGCGFTEIPEEKLKEAMMTKADQIEVASQVTFENMGKTEGKADVTFHLSRSKNTDNYFFTSYTLQVASGDKNIFSPKQKFYVDSNIKAREGYNLLEGRSVYKTQINQAGQPYKAWLHLDFKNTDKNGNYLIDRYGENYGFDLEGKLKELPIKDFEKPEVKREIIQSIEEGNRQTVTYVVDGKDETRHIEAVPQYKLINVYNEDHRLVRENRLNAGEQKKNAQSNERAVDEKTGITNPPKKNNKASAKQDLQKGKQDAITVSNNRSRSKSMHI